MVDSARFTYIPVLSNVQTNYAMCRIELYRSNAQSIERTRDSNLATPYQITKATRSLQVDTVKLNGWSCCSKENVKRDNG